MHGGTAHQVQSGVLNHNFTHGKHSRVLKEGTPLANLYEEARTDPDLISMSDHIALLQARMQEVLGRSMDSPIPEWQEFVDGVGELEDAWAKSDAKRIQAAVTTLHQMVEAGQRWDTTWSQVTGLMDHIRKLADTEIKRKKDLGMMIPIERVMALMTAVAHSVKARVSNVEEVQAVFGDITRLHGGSALAVSGGQVIDADPEQESEMETIDG